MRIGRAAITNVPGKATYSIGIACIFLTCRGARGTSDINQIDYLNPTLVPDEFLGHQIQGYTGGHDAWGFQECSKTRESGYCLHWQLYDLRRNRPGA